MPEARAKYDPILLLAESYCGALWRSKIVEGDDAGRFVTVRVLSDVTEGDRAAVRKAAQAARGLEHEHWLSVLDVVDESNGLSIAHTSAKGLVLRAALEQLEERVAPQPPNVALRIGMDLLSAAQGLLDHAKALQAGGFAHAGLTPDSFMICADGVCRMLEPGLASTLRKLKRYTQDQRRLGYDAAEVLQVGVEAGPASDVFSLAAIIWELVTGKRLFAGNVIKVMSKLRAGNVARVDAEIAGTPSDLADVIDKALAAKAQDRYGTPGEMLSALAGLDLQPASRETIAELVRELSPEQPDDVPDSVRMLLISDEPPESEEIPVQDEDESEVESEVEEPPVDVDAEPEARKPIGLSLPKRTAPTPPTRPLPKPVLRSLPKPPGSTLPKPPQSKLADRVAPPPKPKVASKLPGTKLTGTKPLAKPLAAKTPAEPRATKLTGRRSKPVVRTKLGIGNADDRELPWELDAPSAGPKDGPEATAEAPSPTPTSPVATPPSPAATKPAPIAFEDPSVSEDDEAFPPSAVLEPPAEPEPPPSPAAKPKPAPAAPAVTPEPAEAPPTATAKAGAKPAAQPPLAEPVPPARASLATQDQVDALAAMVAAEQRKRTVLMAAGVAVLVVIALLIAFGGGGDDDKTPATTSSTPAPPPPPPPAPPPPPPEPEPAVEPTSEPSSEPTSEPSSEPSAAPKPKPGGKPWKPPPRPAPTFVPNDI